MDPTVDLGSKTMGVGIMLLQPEPKVRGSWTRIISWGLLRVKLSGINHILWGGSLTKGIWIQLQYCSFLPWGYITLLGWWDVFIKSSVDLRIKTLDVGSLLFQVESKVKGSWTWLISWGLLRGKLSGITHILWRGSLTKRVCIQV